MRALLATFLLVTLSFAAAVSAQDNVLVIVADDLGVDYVGCYGEGTNPPPTPNIDALASNGVLFRNAWANPSCSPTRACIQTGRYPFRTLVGRWIGHYQNPQNIGLLQASELTLPEVLDAAGSGYAHALIGKWHLHDSFTPIDSPRTIGGYSHFAGSLEGQIPSYTSWTRVVDGAAAATTAYCTTQNTDDALSWISAQTSPWLCVLTYQAPHIPYHAPPANLHTQNLAGLTPQATTHTPANIPFYRAMVESLDTEMGRLFATLGPGVMNATNVIFIGDNGSVQRQSVAPFDGNRSKGTPYEGGVNVPLLVSGPAVTQPGREVAALACAVDVFKTVIDLADAGAGLPPFLPNDSVSLVPYLNDPQQAPIRQYAYTEQFNGTAWPDPMNNGHATIRDARYKLIHRYSGGGDELFDLQLDPWETNNLINSSDPAIQQAKLDLLAQIGLLRSTGEGSGFVMFGSGNCQGSLGEPTIAGSGDATVGGTFYVDLGNAPVLVIALFVFGFSATSWNGAPLPIELSLIGAHPDCELASSPDILEALLTGFAGGASKMIQLPPDPSLANVTVFGAWVVLDAGAPANPASLVSTDSLAVTIGS